MPQLSFAEAARLAGVDNSTVHRYVRRGLLSAVRLPNGRRAIELSELVRVFPDIAAGPGTPQQGAEQTAAPASPATVELLQRELAAAREREQRLLTMLEQEQAARRELELRLLPAPRVGLLDRLAGWFRRD